MNKTKIEWCDSTWNPLTGCLHDCQYCYARRIASRFGGHKGSDHIVELENREEKPYPYDFIPTLHRYRLDITKKWSESRNIFVCSMADLFGDWVPNEWIDEVMKACANAPKHNYLFLTNNPKRYFQYFEGSWQMIPSEFYDFSKVTLFTGTTVTNQDDYDKYFNAGDLVYCDFLSIEPIHEMIDLAYFSYSVDPRIKWVIIGAETGNRKDKVAPEKEWIDEIVEQCDECGVPVFMKDSLAPIIGEENMRREFPKELKK